MKKLNEYINEVLIKQNISKPKTKKDIENDFGITITYEPTKDNKTKKLMESSEYVDFDILFTHIYNLLDTIKYFKRTPDFNNIELTIDKTGNDYEERQENKIPPSFGYIFTTNGHYNLHNWVEIYKVNNKYIYTWTSQYYDAPWDTNSDYNISGCYEKNNYIEILNDNNSQISSYCWEMYEQISKQKR